MEDGGNKKTVVVLFFFSIQYTWFDQPAPEQTPPGVQYPEPPAYS